MKNPQGILFVVVIQLLSCVQLYVTPWNVAFQDPVLHHLPEFTLIYVLWAGDAICLLLLLPSSFPSIRVFSNESSLSIRWPKYWSFSFSVSISSEYWGLIFFRIDWFDLPVVQGTLKSLLQHHNSKAPIFWCSVFMFQISHPYMTTGKTIALTIQTLGGKVMFLLFNALSLSQLFFQGTRVFYFHGCSHHTQPKIIWSPRK